MPTGKISVLINTFNEEANIRNCLESVKWADEIVLVDMHSDDKTVEIAKNYTSKIFYFERVGYADPARQFGLTKTTNDWVFLIDADEMVPVSLSNQLRAISAANLYDVIMVPRKNYIYGEVSLQSPLFDMQPRLFRRESVKFDGVVHDFTRLKSDAKTMPITDPASALIHFAYTDVESVLQKINKYTTIEVNNIYSGIKKYFPTTRGTVFAIFKAFFREYFKYGGYRNGAYGFSNAIVAASYPAAVYLKLRLTRRYSTANVLDSIRADYSKVAKGILEAY